MAAEKLLAAARVCVAKKVAVGGKVDAKALDREQRAVHAFAWYATYVEALRQMASWARKLDAEKRFGEIEKLILQSAFGEYLGQLAGGIAMSQGEIARPYNMGVGNEHVGEYWDADVDELTRIGTSREVRDGIANYLRAHAGAMFYGEPGLDETMGMVREQFYRFAQEKVTPFAHQWHLKDELIPLPVISELSELGVFGLSLPEEFGGSGLSKTAMCVVSEELSRGYIGVGSLATRSEIACELILTGGTEEQKNYWLPKIASGEILPTA
ncbi:MAG: acyl-CoA dehydrogenase family protein, partial [Rhizomicrobium sp.]